MLSYNPPSENYIEQNFNYNVRRFRVSLLARLQASQMNPIFLFFHWPVRFPTMENDISRRIASVKCSPQRIGRSSSYTSPKRNRLKTPSPTLIILWKPLKIPELVQKLYSTCQLITLYVVFNCNRIFLTKMVGWSSSHYLITRRDLIMSMIIYLRVEGLNMKQIR